MNKNNTIKKHYTIVELLLVILVVGILLGIGVLGVNRAVTGSGVSGAIRNIGGRLNVARSFAVTSNQKVAVVFPMIVSYKETALSPPTVIDPLDDSSLVSSAEKYNFRNKYLFRSLRVCVVKWDTSVTPYQYRFVRWCENDDWTFLPNGTYCNFYFDEIGTSNLPALIYGVDMDPDNVVPLPSGSTGIPELGMPGIVFSPGGALDPEMGTPNIKIVAFREQFNAAMGPGSSKGKFMIRSFEPKNENSKIDKGWIYIINPFTGLGKYDRTSTRDYNN